jgi:hypothetical protein
VERGLGPECGGELSCMGKQTLAQPVGKMTVGEFKELVQEEMAEAARQMAEARVAYAANVGQQQPDSPAEGRLVGDMTLGELRALIREVLEEERRRDYYIDEEGNLVFFSEEAYADYLDKQEGKLPSEVNAYFFDEQGFRAIYCDYEPTPEKARELDEAREQIAEGKVHRLEDVIKKLGLEVGSV